MDKRIILLVEDDSLQRDSLGCCLEDMGYLVLPYGRGDESIKDIYAGLKYDVAIIDRRLERGGYDGDEVMDISKRVNPDASVICVTGYLDESPNAHYNIPKPVDFDYLERTLKECLSR